MAYSWTQTKPLWCWSISILPMAGWWQFSNKGRILLTKWPVSVESLLMWFGLFEAGQSFEWLWPELKGFISIYMNWEPGRLPQNGEGNSFPMLLALLESNKPENPALKVDGCGWPFFFEKTWGKTRNASASLISAFITWNWPQIW